MKKSISWQYLPYILLIAYVAYISYSFFNFKNRLSYLLDHPVHILQDAREIKTRLGEMQHILPHLMTTPDLSYEQIVNILEYQEEQQDNSFASIKKIFLGDPAYITMLEEAFKQVRAKRREAARLLIGNSDYSKSMQIYKSLVSQYANKVNYAIGKIIANGQILMNREREQTNREVFLNIIITILVGILISIAFLIVTIKDRHKTRLLEDRERLFNLLSKNVDEIFIVAFNKARFSYVTTNSERLIGIASEKICTSPQILYNFLSPEDAEWLKGALDSPEGKISGERTVISDNGKRIFRITLYPINDPAGQRFIIAVQDKTDDYLHQQALSDALENAHAASIAKSTFLAHMSHEIRTPMNAIIGMTTIALSKIGNQERVLDCLGKIAESSRHLLRLINDVLDMSKIETGKLAINQETFSLPTCIRNINDLVRPQAEDHNLEFEIYQEEVDEDRLIGDPLRLNQVLLNILSNSLKFTPAGGQITLTIRQISKCRGKVRLEFVIRDTGIGMSQEFLERLYLPFEQESSATAGKYGGTGLGMSITFNLVTLMGGNINVETQEGKGTCFHVELTFSYEEGRKERAESLPPLRVLVVDDDPGTCEHAALLLEKMGLSVRWCSNGKKAIEMIKKNKELGLPFDVCFLDWKMPEMDGAETAKKIREEVDDLLLIIIISAYDWSPIEEKARQAGVNDFVAKPFFASTLFNVLISTTQHIGVNNKDVASSTQNYDFKGKRILLVEDNDFNREIALEFLNMVNADVENAENGVEAVEKFSAAPAGYYDLILMDIQMPLMNGYDATKAIRALKHPDAGKIHILAMTANAFSEDVANAVAAGMNGHIAKPIDVRQLHRLIHTHLELYRKERESADAAK